jgi:hypothetical protein
MQSKLCLMQVASKCVIVKQLVFFRDELISHVNSQHCLRTGSHCSNKSSSYSRTHVKVGTLKLRVQVV